MDLDALERLFHRALELPPDQRDRFLRQECSGQDTLRQEVLRLLDRDTQAEGLLQSPLSVSDHGGEALRPGQELGSYQLLDVLGRGGMGEVWLAQRADGAYEQKVALKVMRSARRPDAVARFEQERQIQASLDHPGIARLLDAGQTPGGRPYYVVEHVDGEPVDAWCDRRKLTLEERLALFQEICRVVDHAHQNLVIHRDLKPANILVTRDGRPKLLDFGIAKILEGPPRDAPHTQEGHQPLTPRFASPEQFQGRPVSVSSDVFSLGVLLYLLLTGRLPFEEKSTSEELQEAVCGTPPPSPSRWFRDSSSSSTTRWNADQASQERRTTIPRLGRRLQGDLDAIVERALQRDTAERYASVRELAEDVGRFLERRPVLARAGSRWYQVQRFVQRNRLLVGTSTLALVGLVAALVTSTRLVRTTQDSLHREAGLRTLAEQRLEEIQGLTTRLEGQVREAEEQRARAETLLAEVRHFASRTIFDLFQTLYGLEGANDALRKAVQTGLEALETLRDEAQDDPEILRELMAAHSRMASLQGGGLSVDSRLQEQALWNAETAVELGRRLLELEPDQDANLMNMSRALLSLSDVLRQRGRGAEAEAADREALEWSDGLADPGFKPGFLVVRTAALRQVAEWELVSGAAGRAATLAQQGLELLEPAPRRFPGSADVFYSEMAALQILIARHHLQAGDPDSALVWTRTAVELSETHDRLRAMTLQALQWHARALTGAGEFGEAEDLLYEMLAEVEAGLERFPADVQRQVQHLQVYLDLCRLAIAREHWDGFDLLAEEARQVARASSPGAAGGGATVELLLQLQNLVVRSWLDRRDWDEAQDALDRWEADLAEHGARGPGLASLEAWTLRARRDRAAILVGRAEDASAGSPGRSTHRERARDQLASLEQELVSAAALTTARRRLLEDVRDLSARLRALSERAP